MSEHNLTVEEIADGLALWEEHQPQSAEDWIAVAERFIAADGDVTKSSSEFSDLVTEVVIRDHYRERVVEVEEKVLAAATRLTREAT